MAKKCTGYRRWSSTGDPKVLAAEKRHVKRLGWKYCIEKAARGGVISVIYVKADTKPLGPDYHDWRRGSPNN
jgi:hypothetical protein